MYLLMKKIRELIVFKYQWLETEVIEEASVQLRGFVIFFFSAETYCEAFCNISIILSLKWLELKTIQSVRPLIVCTNMSPIQRFVLPLEN